jgi:hypothetical protein
MSISTTRAVAQQLTALLEKPSSEGSLKKIEELSQKLGLEVKELRKQGSLGSNEKEVSEWERITTEKVPQHLEKIKKANEDKENLKKINKKNEEQNINNLKDILGTKPEEILKKYDKKEIEVEKETPKKEIDVETKKENKKEELSEEPQIGIKGKKKGLNEHGKDHKMAEKAKEYLTANPDDDITLTLDQIPTLTGKDLLQGTGFRLDLWLLNNLFRSVKKRLDPTFGKLPEEMQWKLHLPEQDGKKEWKDGIGSMILGKNDKIDLTEITKFSKKLSNRPVLVTHGENVYIYGYSKNNEWELTKLDPEFADYSNNNNTIINPPTELRDEIIKQGAHLRTVAEIRGLRRPGVNLDDLNKNDDYNIKVKIPKPPSKNDLINKIAANDSQFKALVQQINNDKSFYGRTMVNPSVEDIQKVKTEKMLQLKNEEKELKKNLEQSEQQRNKITATDIPEIDKQIKKLDDELKNNDISEIREKKTDLEEKKTELTKTKTFYDVSISSTKSKIELTTTKKEKLEKDCETLIKQVEERDNKIEEEQKKGIKNN